MSANIIAFERMDTWVFRVSIAVPVVCLVGLVLWHLVSYLSGRFFKTRREGRQALEAPPFGEQRASRIEERRSRVEDRHDSIVDAQASLVPGPGGTQATPIKNDPELLEQVCAARLNSLADAYLELAECWLHKGATVQAAATWAKVVQTCPQTRQAQVARERLRQLGVSEHHS
jgi:hypothetical protein